MHPPPPPAVFSHPKSLCPALGDVRSIQHLFSTSHSSRKNIIKDIPAMDTNKTVFYHTLDKKTILICSKLKLQWLESERQNSLLAVVDQL